MSTITALHDRVHRRDIPDQLELEKLEEVMAADLRQLERHMNDLSRRHARRAGQRIEQQWRQARLGHGRSRPWV